MQITTELVGANFRPSEAKLRVKTLQIGDSLTLSPDPHNAYDSHAVQVIADGLHIGFIPKSDNLEIFEHLSDQGEYTCTITGFPSSLKPTLAIELI